MSAVHPAPLSALVWSLVRPDLAGGGAADLYTIHARSHYDALDQALITSAGHAVGEATAMGADPHLVERPDQLEVLRLDGLAFDPVVGLLPSLVVPLPIPGERIFRRLPNP